jgi:hypothetical protein
MAVVLRNVAIVVVSLILVALESAAAERRRMAEAVTNGTNHDAPRATTLRRKEATIVAAIRVSVLGRTKRCLYRAARVSVDDSFVF